MPGTPTIAALWLGGGRGKEEAAPDAECSCQAGASPQHMQPPPGCSSRTGADKVDEELSLHSDMPTLWQPKFCSLLISCSDYIIGGTVLHLSLDADCHFCQVKGQLPKQTKSARWKKVLFPGGAQAAMYLQAIFVLCKQRLKG